MMRKAMDILLFALFFCLSKVSCDQKYNLEFNETCEYNLQCNSGCCHNKACVETDECNKTLQTFYETQAYVCAGLVLIFCGYLTYKLKELRKVFDKKKNDRSVRKRRK